MNRRFWLCGAMTLLSSIVSAYFSLTGLWAARADQFAQYAASRSVALLLVVLLSVLLRRRAALLVLAWCMSCVQVMDGWVGLLEHNPGETYGPWAFALVNAILAYWLWKDDAGAFTSRTVDGTMDLRQESTDRSL